MLDILISDYNAANGENSFHKTPLRWRRIMVESVDSSRTYKECVSKVKSQIKIKLTSLGRRLQEVLRFFFLPKAAVSDTDTDS